MTTALATTSGAAPLSETTTSRRLLAAFLTGRTAQTLRAYHGDLEDFRAFLGAAALADAAELLLARGHGAANELGLLAVAALVAVREVLVPVEVSSLGLAGLAALLQTVERVRERLNPELAVSAILPCRVDGRTNLSRDVVERLEARFPELVLPPIRESVRLREAPSFAKPITLYAPPGATKRKTTEPPRGNSSPVVHGGRNHAKSCPTPDHWRGPTGRRGPRPRVRQAASVTAPPKEVVQLKSEPSTPCIVCENAVARPDLYFYLWRGRRFWIYRCTQCTHQFVYPPVTQEDQALIYGDDYFSQDGDWAAGFFGTSYVEAEAELRAEARKVIAMLPSPPGKLLDIGCAGGTFLDEARKRGFDVAGIELNPSMAQYARSTYQLEVLTSRVEDLPPDQWSAGFEVVTLLDVLEHLPAPLATMSTVARWVRPDGFIFIRGPLSNSRVGRVKEGIRRSLRLTKRLPGYPLDANMFNKRSLSFLLSRSGFTITEWIGETTSFSNLLARRNPAV
jgi:SAM-dependent methyltransferase